MSPIKLQQSQDNKITEKNLKTSFTVRRYALRDDQWERIKDHLPGRKETVGVTAKDNRLLVEAVLYRYGAGIAWRGLPEHFGDFRVIHQRHSRWSKKGVWERVFKVLSQDADDEYAMIDSTIMHTPQYSAGAKKKPLNNSLLGEVPGD